MRRSSTVIFATIDELEEVQLARCAVLQHRRALLEFQATLFWWWPQRITKL